MSNSLVSINLVVFNGEKYIRHSLMSVKNQAYPHGQIEINILDNNSTDATKKIVAELAGEFSDFLKFNLIESGKNVGMWPGHEELLKHSAGEYVVFLSVDVVLDKYFTSNAVKIMDKDSKIGAVQAKTYSYDVGNVGEGDLPKKIIDTCGFQAYKSRRIINMGHGEMDNGQFNQEKEIFAVEGAVPVFRKKALEGCRILGEIADHDMFWYAEDLDVAWRMRVFGWKQMFAPDVIAWHDRQTTKNLRKTFYDFIKIRRQIPLQKRRLEWRNIRFTVIKNDYIINILKDLPFILKREVMMLCYLLIFEPKVLSEMAVFFRLLPKILRKRKQIVNNRVVSSEEMRKWFK